MICSGSLLGISYQRIESNSVGYKQDFSMHSMDFEEFLWAKGYGESVADDIFWHMIRMDLFSTTELAVFEPLFLDYCVLGGMPAVVREYIRTGTFEGTLMIQRQLLADYKEDIRKYAVGMDQTRITQVFEQWLRDAGLVNVCYCLNYPELPLKGNYLPDQYKLYYADTGMLVAMLDEEAQEDLRANKNMNVYKGALYENIVAEAFVKSGYHLRH